jgi:hypothetical protein
MDRLTVDAAGRPLVEASGTSVVTPSALHTILANWAPGGNPLVP